MKINKKIKDLTPEEAKKMSDIISKCNIVTFDEKEINEKIIAAYDMRVYAYDLLLEADLLIDEVLKELTGKKDEPRKGLAKNTKAKRLGKKV